MSLLYHLFALISTYFTSIVWLYFEHKKGYTSRFVRGTAFLSPEDTLQYLFSYEHLLPMAIEYTPTMTKR